MLPPVCSQHRVQNDPVHISRVMSLLCSEPFSDSQLIQSKSQSPSTTHKAYIPAPSASPPLRPPLLTLVPWLSWLWPHWSPCHSLLPKLLHSQISKRLAFSPRSDLYLNTISWVRSTPAILSKIAIPSPTPERCSPPSLLFSSLVFSHQHTVYFTYLVSIL